MRSSPVVLRTSHRGKRSRAVMLHPLLLSASFLLGQTGHTQPGRTPIPPSSSIAQASVAETLLAPPVRLIALPPGTQPSDHLPGCPDPAGCCEADGPCPVIWLRPWNPEAVELKAFEPKLGY